MRALLIWFWLASVAQAEACRQALVLALDVSGSVNPTEYAQQVNGLASALEDPEVQFLILLGDGPPVRLAVFEWSSRNHQYLIQPWITLDSQAALDTAIARIRAHQKVRAGLRTALGTALTFAAAMLEEQAERWQHTIDVSGDGESNIGPTPQDVYRQPDFDRIKVNALVVADSRTELGDTINQSAAMLEDYYRSEVIHGPNAFVITAEGYADYTRAMRLKLIKELAPPVFGALELR
ncbi:MAG: DUF1194 domain-containing protein [Pseudomonadota bacterium]